ncbi:hypothetical protein [Pendulispora albinea]|uniref:Tetratricopeptide repeat protein n=1 Tax=Pendulispora albinea TaxID=2741071 RepID=A0ABZ2LLW5_9BACT
MNAGCKQKVGFALLVAGALLGGAETARADGDGPRDPMGAEAAFSDARRLMKEGRFEEACPKLETSYRLDPALGSLLNLAECLARTGRTASGWLRYREAAAMALQQGQKERAAIARERAGALEPQLCRLVIHAPASVDDLRRDGTQVRREDADQSVPIDPGAHVIEARAPGFVPFIAHVAIARGASGESCKPVVVDIPADLGGRAEPLRAAAADAPSSSAEPSAPAGPAFPREKPPATAPPARGWSAQHTLSLVAGGAGLVALGIGGGFALDAAASERDADALCRPHGCTNEGLDAHARAGRSADIATAGLITGAVLLVGGAVLWFTAPSLRRPAAPMRGAMLRF